MALYPNLPIPRQITLSLVLEKLEHSPSALKTVVSQLKIVSNSGSSHSRTKRNSWKFRLLKTAIPRRNAKRDAFEAAAFRHEDQLSTRFKHLKLVRSSTNSSSAKAWQKGQKERPIGMERVIGQKINGFLITASKSDTSIPRLIDHRPFESERLPGRRGKKRKFRRFGR